MGEPQQKRLDTVTAIAVTNEQRIEALEQRVKKLERLLEYKIKTYDCKWLECEPWEIGGC